MSTEIPQDTEYIDAQTEEANSQRGFPIGRELIVLAVIIGLIFGTAVVRKFLAVLQSRQPMNSSQLFHTLMKKFHQPHYRLLNHLRHTTLPQHLRLYTM